MQKEEYDFELIVNYLSGNNSTEKIVQKIRKYLEENNQTYRLIEIREPTPISKLLENREIQINKGVVCIGGDGTVSETLGYMLKNDIKAPLAIIPTGTANFIATAFKLIKNRKSFDFLLKGKIRAVDVGVIDYGNEKNFFLLGIGLGFQENFLRITKDRLKSRLGVFSYIVSALSKLLTLKKIPLKIIYNHSEISTEICFLTLLNMQASVLRVFPFFKDKEVKCDDKRFDLYYVEYKNFFHAVLGTLVFHLFGKLNFGLVKFIKGEEFTLESPAICGTQVDGELRNCLPVKIYFHHEPCRFLVA